MGETIRGLSPPLLLCFNYLWLYQHAPSLRKIWVVTEVISLWLQRSLNIYSDFLSRSLMEHFSWLRTVCCRRLNRLLHKSLAFLKSFQPLSYSALCCGGRARCWQHHPLDHSGSPQAWWALSRSPLLFFPMHHTCACLHWWSPEVTSPARRAFPGSKGKLERDGLSHVGSPPWISFLGNSAPWKGWPATVLFHQPSPMWLALGKTAI